MIWAEVAVAVVVTVLGAGVMISIMTAEWMLVAPPQADQKGLTLLHSWLSPEQARQYAHKYFEVIGCDTGTRYPIQYGSMMNIEQLNSAGNKVCEWCFVPEGRLVAGDVMLAQKIALETFESEALAIANRGSGPTWRQAVRSQPPFWLP
jgi:hypothetical protein